MSYINNNELLFKILMWNLLFKITKEKEKEFFFFNCSIRTQKSKEHFLRK